MHKGKSTHESEKLGPMPGNMQWDAAMNHRNKLHTSQQQQQQTRQRKGEHTGDELVNEWNGNGMAPAHLSSPLLEHAKLEVLQYSIHSYSSFSANYIPSNILVDKPMDQASRWSSGANNHAQFLTIALDKPAILYTITFGKYHKVHVCNIKEFKVFGGMNIDNMVELLHSGLRNDSEPEILPLRYRTAAGTIFPVKYLKIIPLLAWGANFNFSIWHVELRGKSSPETVQPILETFNNAMEMEAVRLCLKFFRDMNWTLPFESLQTQTGISIEDPLLTRLFRHIVQESDWHATEELLLQGMKNGWFEEYAKDVDYKPVWGKILATDEFGNRPSMRGGHQMTIDPDNGVVYLLGGWNGSEDLADFWSFDIRKQRWKCIAKDTRTSKGPGPRSCHKITFDPTSRRIYVLGRYVDPDARIKEELVADFFAYEIDTARWIKISNDTISQGGPELIYDHQMCVDQETGTLWVFGGRTISRDEIDKSTAYSGLYRYNIAQGTWLLVRSDLTQKEPVLRSRIGHSMIFNPVDRHLYIFAGQRVKDYLSDFYSYSVDEDIVVELTRDSSRQGGPDAGFTQRATFDVDLGEVYVLSGLMREKNASSESIKNAFFWCFELSKSRWRRVYKNESVDDHRGPTPRFAHQLVYDPITKTQYLFGGNPGDSTDVNKRLDDFWELRLIRPTRDIISRKVKFLVRTQCLREMIAKGSIVESLEYLQTEVSAVVDHNDEEESQCFRELTGSLFLSPKPSSTATSNRDFHTTRTALFEEIMRFLPRSLKQPFSSLVDLVPKNMGDDPFDGMIRGAPQNTAAKGSRKGD